MAYCVLTAKLRRYIAGRLKNKQDGRDLTRAAYPGLGLMYVRELRMRTISAHRHVR